MGGEVLDSLKTTRGCALAWKSKPSWPVGGGGKRRHPRGFEDTATATCGEITCNPACRPPSGSASTIPRLKSAAWALLDSSWTRPMGGVHGPTRDRERLH